MAEELKGSLPSEDIRSNEKKLKFESFVHEFFNQLMAFPGPYPIISSYGAQSIGKSFLLNKLFNADFNTKRDPHDGRCTDNFNFKMIDDQYMLFDFEGIGCTKTSSARDNINFSTAFLFSSIVFIQIKSERLVQDKCMDEGFSYSYWLALRALLEFKLKPPKIYFFIRDHDGDDKETFAKSFT